MIKIKAREYHAQWHLFSHQGTHAEAVEALEKQQVAEGVRAEVSQVWGEIADLGIKATWGVWLYY